MDSADTPEDQRPTEADSPALKRMLANIPGAVYRCRHDPHWTMHYISDGIEDLSGYPASHFIDNRVRSYASIIHPDDRQYVWETVEAQVRRHQPYALQYRIVTSNGEVRWVVERGRAHYAGSGEASSLDGAILDFSEQKAAEEALRASERRMNLLTSGLPALVAYVSPDQRYQVVNDTYSAWWGRTAGQFPGKAVREIVGDTNYRAIAPYLVRAIAGERVGFSMAALHPGGDERFLDVAYAPDLDNGQVRGVFCVVSDVTRHKRAERDLLRSKQVLDAVFDNLYTLVAYLDPDMNFIMVNEAYAAGDGKQPEYFIGKNHFDLFPNTENERIFRRVVETGEPYYARAKPFEYAEHPERGVSHWDWTLKPVTDGAGKVSALVLNLVNVTERIKALEQAQESERRFRAMFENASDGIAYIRPGSFSVAGGNARFAAMLGYAPEELVGLTSAALQPAALQPELTSLVANALHADGIGLEDVPLRRKDGTVMYAQVSFARIQYHGRDELVGFFRDVTDKRAAAEALQRLNEALEERVQERTRELSQAKEFAERASRAKTDFLARMSHELRTPLNAILGFAQILQSSATAPLMPSQKSAVREILDGGCLLLELINEVLDLARIEAGSLRLEAGSVDVRAAVQHAAALVKPLADERSIVLKTDIAPDVQVAGDDTRLRQVLINLLSNAIKYNRDRGAVQVRAIPGDGARLRISVTDTGMGISAADLSRLFVPFERAPSVRDSIEGTGIGLALSKRLIELMGGCIGVQSALGEGSTFWVELPVAEGARAGAAAAGTEQAALAQHQARATVLYVEDQPANLRLMESILATRPGTRMLAAHTPRLGLELAAAHQPDLILLDIQLPGMSGFEVLKRLRADAATAAIPVIAVTADAMPADVERGKAAGFADYVTKPLDVPRFLHTLERWLRR